MCSCAAMRTDIFFPRNEEQQYLDHREDASVYICVAVWSDPEASMRMRDPLDWELAKSATCGGRITRMLRETLVHVSGYASPENETEISRTILDITTERLESQERAGQRKAGFYKEVVLECAYAPFPHRRDSRKQRAALWVSRQNDVLTYAQQPASAVSLETERHGVTKCLVPHWPALPPTSGSALLGAGVCGKAWPSDPSTRAAAGVLCSATVSELLALLLVRYAKGDPMTPCMHKVYANPWSQALVTQSINGARP